MIRIYIALIAFFLIGCNPTPKNELILGEWNLVSMTDLKTLEIKTDEGKGGRMSVSITSDLVIISSENEKEDKYRWSMFGDSINLTLDGDTVAQIYLKTLNEELLEVEVDIFLMDSTRLVFERNKKATKKK